MQLPELDPNKLYYPNIAYPNLFRYVLLVYYPRFHQMAKQVAQ